jgi:hypothetical protein
MSKWETVGGKTVATSKMEIGASFEGTFVELQENTNSQYERTDKEGNPKKQYNLVFIDTNGDRVVVYPSGTLNYKIDDGVFEKGVEYRITRQENRKGTRAGQFLLERAVANS